MKNLFLFLLVSSTTLFSVSANAFYFCKSAGCSSYKLLKDCKKASGGVDCYPDSYSAPTVKGNGPASNGQVNRPTSGASH